MRNNAGRVSYHEGHPKKLRDGTWGAILSAPYAQVGDSVRVKTRGGKSWEAVISKIVWQGDGKTIAATR